MTPADRDRPATPWSLDPAAARTLVEHSVVRDLDRSGTAHFLVKVPDLDKAMQAEFGVEIEREEDGCVAVSVLLYDIPTEPVTYDLRFYPDSAEDLRFLYSLLDSGQFRLYPCGQQGSRWNVGPAQTFRLPTNALLRLKHYSLTWPAKETGPETAGQEPAPPAAPRASDPRDTVIRKLKEQVQALRAQMQERDKRIIELEDELNAIKSRGREYRLSGDRKPWWKPF
ncbi:MAG: hypothetical protein SCH98_08805 [Deferrisomatales bacterium]|nr:hypothetical protein [Deferrisomatales bacterium]